MKVSNVLFSHLKNYNVKMMNVKFNVNFVTLLNIINFKLNVKLFIKSKKDVERKDAAIVTGVGVKEEFDLKNGYVLSMFYVYFHVTDLVSIVSVYRKFINNMKYYVVFIKNCFEYSIV